MAESITRMGDHEDVNLKSMIERIGDSVGKAYFENGDEGREGTDGRILPVYKDNSEGSD